MTLTELLSKFTEEDKKHLQENVMSEKETYDYLVSKGLTDSYETFAVEAKKYVKENFSKMSKDEFLKQIEGAELTDDQLKLIAGGIGGDSTTSPEEFTNFSAYNHSI